MAGRWPPQTSAGVMLSSASCTCCISLAVVYSLYIRYGALVRKPTTPEQLYIDFDGFFAACEEQADVAPQGSWTVV